MKIKVRARHAYGVLLLDPINEPAEWLAVIAGTKTLTHQVLAAAINMGAEVEIADSSDAAALVAAIKNIAAGAAGRRAA